MRLSIRVYTLLYTTVYMTFGSDDTFLNTPRHMGIRRPMNKDLSNWLKQRMRQMDERVTELNGRLVEGGEDEW